MTNYHGDQEAISSFASTFSKECNVVMNALQAAYSSHSTHDGDIQITSAGMIAHINS